MSEEMTIELVDCERVLLDYIADKEFDRKAVALTYRLAIMSSERPTINWEKVNKAIIERWSLSALKFIKNKAWKGVNVFEICL